MSTYLVSFVDDHARFHVVMNNQADLENIALALKETFVFPPPHAAGKAAASFIYWASGGKDTYLTHNIDGPGYDNVPRLKVFLRDHSVYVSIVDNGRRRCLFSGSIMSFLDWTTKDPLLGKTIVFRYTSGSAVGNRVVKVEKVERKRGTVYYCGKDLKKGEYRCYDRRYIDGEILVMDEDGSVAAA